MEQVFFKQLDNYDPAAVLAALRQVLLPAAEKYGGFAGKKVMIKPNFLEYRRPDDPACVHPVMLTGLCTLLHEENAAAIAVVENPAVRTAPDNDIGKLLNTVQTAKCIEFQLHIIIGTFGTD